ncbi:MAG: hypothetical protein PUC65_15285 [Clostridiales bacterium]|nr:hypothetical protein [Clostridiales bacterium]
MSKFEHTIKKRMHIKIVFCIAGAVAFLTAIILKSVTKNNSQGTDDFPIAVLIGMFGGMEAFSIPTILSYRKALKDKEALEALHISETDERNQMIEWKTCRTCFYITLTLLGYAALITAFFNKTIFFTLGVTLILLCVIYVTVKIIFTRKSYR